MEPQHTGSPESVGCQLDRAIARLDLAGSSVLVAASGGLDSTVLLHALASRAGPHGLRIAAGHVHHGLRGADADADQRAVQAQAEQLCVPFASRRVEPGRLREGCSSRERPTLQEAARSLRYAALREMATEVGADHVATAHHADDQAETVLLRLLRGTGPDGLAGIPERSPDGRIVRPLLSVPKAAILAWARDRGLAWREDASNASDRYARNRLRRLLPGLADAFNPRLLRAIADLAEAQARDSEWIAERVEAESTRRLHVEGAWLRIDATDWSGLPEALSRRVLRSALARCDAARHTSRRHLARMHAFLGSGVTGTRIELPGGLILLRDRAGFRIGPLAGAAPGGPGAPC
jgi:tRNA(Ile)-lysidine synthase